MADKKSPRTPLVLSPEALFRYQIVSAVKARELSGQFVAGGLTRNRVEPTGPAHKRSPTS